MLIWVSVLAGCGGSLNDEQRKQLREGKDQQVIKKVSEAEIVDEAFSKGRAVISLLESNPLAADSLAVAHQVAVRWLEPSSANATEIERQLIDAYLNSMMMGETLKDNVQSLGTDSLLYTKPVTVEQPDGVVEVKGTWNIRMARKQLVLGINK
jgi:hypothetical protein